MTAPGSNRDSSAWCLLSLLGTNWVAEYQAQWERSFDRELIVPDNGSDFLAFRLAFLQQPANPLFDVNGDGQVNGTDFLQFRLRFLQSI